MIRVLFYLVCSVVLCFFAFFAAPNWLRSIYCMVFVFLYYMYCMKLFEKKLKNEKP